MITMIIQHSISITINPANSFALDSSDQHVSLMEVCALECALLFCISKVLLSDDDGKKPGTYRHTAVR